MDTTTKTQALLSEVTPTIRALASRLVRAAGGGLEREDLIQVGLMAALRCAQTYDGVSSAFRTYCWHPVAAEMRRTACASRSVAGMVSRAVSHDASFSTPAFSDGENEVTLGDTLSDPTAATAEELTAKAERETQVRAIIARVRAGWANKAMFDDLLVRLMASTFGGEERNWSEVPLASIGEKHGVSRERVRQIEKQVRVRLERALQPMAAE